MSLRPPRIQSPVDFVRLTVFPGDLQGFIEDAGLTQHIRHYLFRNHLSLLVGTVNIRDPEDEKYFVRLAAIGLIL